MPRRTLRIAFADFWPGFDPAANWFTDTLAPHFDLVPADEPDIVVHSCYGHDVERYGCTRVFVSWENRGWGFSHSDWAFTSDLIVHPRHHRLPLWVCWLDQQHIRHEVDAPAALSEKEGFASVVISNSSGHTRDRLLDALERYRPVASGGRHRNNIGGPVEDKAAFIRRYKFNLACENSSFPGYTTEKLLHALQADTIPIYWGDPEVHRDFNSRRFVNRHEFASDEAMLQRVVELDNDDDAYCAVLREPWFTDDRLPACADLEAVVHRFEEIAAWTGTPVARRRSPGAMAHRLRDRWAIRQRFRQRQR